MSNVNLETFRTGGRCEKHCSIKPCLACVNDELRAALAKAEGERDLALSTIESRDRNIESMADAYRELQAKLTALEGQEPSAIISDAEIDEFLEDYEMSGENEAGQDCYYAPTENDKALIKDAILGFLSDCPSNLYAAAGAAPVQEVWQPDMVHVANEWSDAATNGPQYLRNIRDGICTFEEALSGMARDIAHCRDVRAAMLAAAPRSAS